MSATIVPGPSRGAAGPPASPVQAHRAVVDRAFSLLEAWDHRGQSLGVSELARRTGLPKSTGHRLLGILEAAGLVQRLADGYRIGDRLHGISGLLRADYPPDLREVSLPFLQDLYELTHETIHLGVLVGVDVHCVEKIFGHRRSPVRSQVGGILPAHSTALGKALLGHLPADARRAVLTSPLHAYTAATLTQPARLASELLAVRRSGVAFDRQETHPRACCVAAPVVDARGQAVAALSVSGPSDRFDPAAVAERVRRAARAASVALAATRLDQRAA